jgi:hypothetical protein
MVIIFRYFRFSYCGAPSVMRGRVSNLLVQLPLGLASSVTLGSKSHKTHGLISLSHLRLSSFFVTSYDSHDYGGGVLAHLLTTRPSYITPRGPNIKQCFYDFLYCCVYALPWKCVYWLLVSMETCFLSSHLMMDVCCSFMIPVLGHHLTSLPPKGYSSQMAHHSFTVPSFLRRLLMAFSHGSVSAVVITLVPLPPCPP